MRISINISINLENDVELNVIKWCDYFRDIDEIVLSYVISILEDLGDDSNAEENIDVDQFAEMMEAYIPGFGTIDRFF